MAVGKYQKPKGNRRKNKNSKKRNQRKYVSHTNVNSPQHKNVNRVNEERPHLDLTPPRRIQNRSTNNKAVSTVNKVFTNTESSIFCRRRASASFEREDPMRIQAAERDGAITGLILFVVMAIVFGLYACISSAFPAISPDALADRLLCAFLGWITDFVTGGPYCMT